MWLTLACPVVSHPWWLRDHTGLGLHSVCILRTHEHTHRLVRLTPDNRAPREVGDRKAASRCKFELHVQNVHYPYPNTTHACLLLTRGSASQKQEERGKSQVVKLWSCVHMSLALP